MSSSFPLLIFFSLYIPCLTYLIYLVSFSAVPFLFPAPDTFLFQMLYMAVYFDSKKNAEGTCTGLAGEGDSQPDTCTDVTDRHRHHKASMIIIHFNGENSSYKTEFPLK